MAESLVYPWLLPRVVKPEVLKNNYTRHVTISIVTMGGDLEMLKTCINSIQACTPADFPSSEIYIWHNGPENADEIKNLCVTEFNEHPVFDICYMPSPEGNIGFGPAHNKVTDIANGRYIIFVNDDVEFKHYGWMGMLISELNDKVLQVGARNGATNNRLSSAGGGYLSDNRINEYIEGTVLAMDTDIAKAYGPFDPLYVFAYQEDSDLSLRIQSWGYDIKYVILDFIHHRARTSKKVEIDVTGYQVKNKIKFANRWAWYLSRRDFSPRIAIARAAAMGDVLMATSAIRRIRKLAPFATIDVFTVCPDILENNPDIDHVFPHKALQENAMKYHILLKLDAAYESNPQELAYRAFYQAMTLDEHPIEWPVLVFSDTERMIAGEIIDKHIATYGKGPIAAFHTGRTAWPGRNLECKKFKDAAVYLQSIGWTVIEIGAGDTEPTGVESTKVYGQPPRIAAAVISMCQMFVGIDSFPWNVAQVCKIPSVVAFGCIDPKTRVLDFDLVKPITANGIACLGCHHVFRGPIAQSGCARSPRARIAPCMEAIQSSQLIDAVKTYANGA